MELMATHSDASQCRKQISSFAKTLTVRVATYLAKEIASLFRPVLYHPLMSLTDEDTLPLLTSEFWVRPVYEELGRNPSRSVQTEGSSCVVWVPCGENSNHCPPPGELQFK